MLDELAEWPPLRYAARHQIGSTHRRFETQGGKFLDLASSRWFGMLEPGTWEPIGRLALELRQTAVQAGRAATGQCIEPGQAGRVILVTVAPARGDDLLYGAFPGGDYCEWLRQARKAFRQMPDWTERDFVHWMFLWDEEEIDTHLLYLFSLRALLGIIGWQVTRLKKAGVKEPFHVDLPPRIMPESLISVAEFQAAMEEIEREEKRLFYGE